jgi:hypothetical protein
VPERAGDEAGEELPAGEGLPGRGREAGQAAVGGQQVAEWVQLIEGEPGGQGPGELPGARVALVPEQLSAEVGDREDDPPAVVRVRAAPDQATRLERAQRRPAGRSGVGRWA